MYYNDGEFLGKRMKIHRWNHTVTELNDYN